MYYSGRYLEGHLYEGHAYTEASFGEVGTLRFDAPDGAIHVWEHALHLGGPENGKDNLVVLFHYTNEFCFRNITNMEQSSSELYASLKDERAHFGLGVYASQDEPNVWQLRLRILLNNYSSDFDSL